MNPLESAKLYGNGLVEIDSPVLVERYNTCLDALGLRPTQLTAFRIDGIGWSPDVAAEQDNQDYLSHGDSTPLAVILTPDQKNKPVYKPAYSYQRQLMREYWGRYDREIADLTSQAGICVEMDHGISQYRSPEDLLLLRDVVVRTSVSGWLIEAFNEQRSLIAEFSNRDDAWFNPELRAAIIQSVEQFGDLRSHHFMIPEWSFSQPDFFRAKGFGGVFVLRGLHRHPNVLIFENNEPDEQQLSTSKGFALNDKKWVNLLLEEGVVKVNTEDLKKLAEDLRRIKECLLADAACSQDPEIDFSGLTSAQRRGMVVRLGDELARDYFDLERAELQLEHMDEATIDKLPASVTHLLCQPSAHLPSDKRKVICQLLSRYRPTDVWRLYRHNKHCFYEQYAQWTPGKQRWAIQLITDHLEDNLTD